MNPSGSSSIGAGANAGTDCGCELTILGGGGGSFYSCCCPVYLWSTAEVNRVAPLGITGGSYMIYMRLILHRLVRLINPNIKLQQPTLIDNPFAVSYFIYTMDSNEDSFLE